MDMYEGERILKTFAANAPPQNGLVLVDGLRLEIGESDAVAIVQCGDGADRLLCWRDDDLILYGFDGARLDTLHLGKLHDGWHVQKRLIENGLMRDGDWEFHHDRFPGGSLSIGLKAVGFEVDVLRGVLARATGSGT